MNNRKIKHLKRSLSKLLIGLAIINLSLGISKIVCDYSMHLGA